MRIANALHNGQPKVVILRSEGDYFDLTRALQIYDLTTQHGSVSAMLSVQDLLERDRFDVGLFESVCHFVVVRDLPGCLISGRELRLLAPFERPGQIIALARNYAAHAQESTLPEPHEPIFFSKANTSVIGPGEPIVLPPNLGRIEPEIELAFVIRKRAWHVRESDAADYIAGYTILNDVSAQELQAREIREQYPLFRCKSLKTFTPMGPWLATVDEIGLKPRLQMVLTVNGEVRVTTNTSGLTFGVARLLSFISGYVELMPGDVITTGCPKAAGAIHPGDRLVLEIEGIGVLENPVVAGDEPCPQ
ncbi:MAG: fumarylacetoacetate hydrolase family protein [Acidobacteriota bacterium]